MSGRSWLGVLFLTLGILALSYQGISYTRHRKVLELGSVVATTEEKRQIPISPIAGVVAVIAGALLLPWRSGRDNA